MKKKHRSKDSGTFQKAPNSTVKQDKSPHVHQHEKVDFDLNIRPLEWTEKQKGFIDIVTDKETNYVFCQSPAGTGKTILSTYCGLKMLQEKKIGSIIYCRNPIESSSKGLGFLSGGFEDKMLPYFSPMMDNLNELLPANQIKLLIDRGFIQTIPVGFLKGRTFNNALIIIDEAEDLDLKEILLCLNRLGKFSKMLLIGDFDQANVKNSGFQKTFDAFNSAESMENGIFALTFTSEDIMRNKIIRYIVEKFKYIK